MQTSSHTLEIEVPAEAVWAEVSGWLTAGVVPEKLKGATLRKVSGQGVGAVYLVEVPGIRPVRVVITRWEPGKALSFKIDMKEDHPDLILVIGFDISPLSAQSCELRYSWMAAQEDLLMSVLSFFMPGQKQLDENVRQLAEGVREAVLRGRS